MPTLAIRPMTEADWPEVEAIYRAGIATGHATFEPHPPASWAAFTAGKRTELSLVAADADLHMVGWVAAGPVSTREVYRGVFEHSIYIHPDAAGHGIGATLLTAFIDLADRVGVWTIQSSIFPENTASLRLHRRAGFRQVGRRERIAHMAYGPLAGHWRDTVLLERRTPHDAWIDAHESGEVASSGNTQPHTYETRA